MYWLLFLNHWHATKTESSQKKLWKIVWLYVYISDLDKRECDCLRLTFSNTNRNKLIIKQAKPRRFCLDASNMFLLIRIIGERFNVATTGTEFDLKKTPQWHHLAFSIQPLRKWCKMLIKSTKKFHGKNYFLQHFIRWLLMHSGQM